MKYAPVLALLIAAAACSNDKDSSLVAPDMSDNVVGRSGNVVGQVYTMSNAPDGNAVLAYNRASDGSLTPVATYLTGGLGTGGGLGNQSGITLDAGGKALLVVDAGSNEVSSFRVNEDGTLQLASKVSSGGMMPISVTTSGRFAYVLNAGGAGSIMGFTLSGQGVLQPIAGSSRPLSSAASGPAQIAFDPRGMKLVVTEKATNRLSTYSVDNNGIATGPVVTAASGMTPFGFAFTNNGTLIVSEAFGGAVDGSAVSSYSAAAGNQWSVVSGSVATTETAACWIAVTNDGQFAYATNAGSGTITGYSVRNGALTRLNADGVTGIIGAGSAPTEMAFSRDSKYLYAFSGAMHRIAVFSVSADGSLAALPNWPAGLPNGANGLAAR